jgi:hypothetical protein
VNLSDLHSYSVGYGRQGSPEWEHLKWAYEAINVESDLVKHLKMDVHPDPVAAWPESEMFKEMQRTRYANLVEGNVADFTYLVLDLSIDPETGKSERADSDDLRTFIGMTILPSDAATVLVDRAVAYLIGENDHRDIFLGKSVWGYHAAAGDLALALLYRTGQLGLIPDQRWAEWTGIVFAIGHGHSGKDDDRMREMIRCFNVFAAPELAATIEKEVEGNLARGLSTAGLRALAPTAQLVADVMLGLVSRIAVALLAGTSEESPNLAVPDTEPGYDAARHMWQTLLELLVVTDNSTALELLRTTLNTTSDLQLAVRAAVVLLEHDPNTAWPLVKTKLTSSPTLVGMLAAALDHKGITRLTLADLDVSALIDLYLIVAKQFPPTKDVHTSGFYADRDHARDLRGGALNILIDTGTVAAVAGIRRIASIYPEVASLQTALILARRQAQERAFPHLTPAQVAELLHDTRLRSINSNQQLAQVIIETLRDIERSLDTHGNLLWDCERKYVTIVDEKAETINTWRPKPEEALSAYLAHELGLRLNYRGIIMNREVVIRPTDAKGAGGERLDIYVQAAPQKGPQYPQGTTGIEILSVPIEIKGCWNAEVPTSQTKQLAERYLKPGERDVGIYLIGMFPIERWDAEKDGRKSNAKQVRDKVKLQLDLDVEAEDIAKALAVRTLPILITIDRAHKAGGQVSNS